MINVNDGAPGVRHGKHASQSPAVPPAPPAAISAERSWRDSAYLPLRRAAFILGISPSSIYRLEQEGVLKFQRILGRTLVRTEGVIALADSTEPWRASSAGEVARARRAELVEARRAGGRP